MCFVDKRFLCCYCYLVKLKSTELPDVNVDENVAEVPPVSRAGGGGAKPSRAGRLTDEGSSVQVADEQEQIMATNREDYIVLSRKDEDMTVGQVGGFYSYIPSEAPSGWGERPFITLIKSLSQ